VRKISGVYKIQSILKPERIYIGSAKNINTRWGIHLSELRRNKHHSIKLQNHFNKYGQADLQFSILLGCDIEDLIKTEQYFIDSYKPWFNVCPNAGSNIGFHHSQKTKDRLRVTSSRKHTIESKLKIGKSHTGLKRSLASRLKQGATLKGHKISEETKEKIRNTLLGVKHTEERKQNISIGHLGQKSWNKGKHDIYSEETRKRISESQKGRIAWNKGLKFIDGHYICQN
jgi:group I intron endonuclease